MIETKEQKAWDAAVAQCGTELLKFTDDAAIVLKTPEELDELLRAVAAAAPESPVAIFKGYVDDGTPLVKLLESIPAGTKLFAESSITDTVALGRAPDYEDGYQNLLFILKIIAKGGSACENPQKLADLVSTLPWIEALAKAGINDPFIAQRADSGEAKPVAWAAESTTGGCVRMLTKISLLESEVDRYVNREDMASIGCNRVKVPLYRTSQPYTVQPDSERDAARYRWLRNADTDLALVIDKVTGYVPDDESIPGVGGYNTYEYRAGDELDSAIDAAMAAQQGEIGGAA